MGIVKEHLTHQIKDLKTKGLCVWLDTKKEYGGFVESLQRQRREGQFEYPVLAFQGSFLELMLELSPYFSSKNNQPCLVHMPGFNQTTTKDTPLLEAYKAGKKVQYNLKALVRNIGAGKLAAEQLNHLLEDKDFSLELADLRLTEEDRTPAGLKRLISRHSVIEIAIDLLQEKRKFIDDEIELPLSERFGAVRCYLELQFGFIGDFLGLEEGSSLDAASDVSNLRFPLAAHLLCTEYVWDLREEAIDDRLKPLKNVSGNQHKNCRRVTEELRARHNDLYIALVQEIEPRLVAEAQQAPDHFGGIDTFQFEEEKFLNHAFQFLKKGEWKSVLALVEQRAGADQPVKEWKSFWVQHDERRRWVWRWLHMIAILGQKLVEAKEAITKGKAKNITPTQLLEKYTASRGLYQVDQYHREFEQWTARLTMLTGLPHFTTITLQTQRCRELYRNYIDALARLFNESCKQHGFLPKEEYRQRNFHRQVVEPLLAEEPVVVFYIDAFRYELGNMLAKRLEEDRGTAYLKARLAELPTVTSVGMNALMPLGKNGHLTPLFDNKKGIFIGFRSGEKPIDRPSARGKLLQEVVSVPCLWVSLKEMLDKSPADIKKMLRGKKLMCIHSLEIDEIGETGLLSLMPDYFENTINRLVTTVRRLQEARYQQFIFTSDHGFLQADETLKGEPVPHVAVETKRYILHSHALETNKTTSVSLTALNYKTDGEQSYLIFPLTGDLFQKPGRKDRFYHGGNSLQERVIPVLTYKKEKLTSSHENAQFQIKAKSASPMMGYHRILLKVTNISIFKPIFEDTHYPIHLQIEPAQSLNCSVLIGDVMPGMFKGNRIEVPIEKDIEVCFKILGGSEEKIQLKIFHPERIDAVEPFIMEEYFQGEAGGVYPASITGKSPKPASTQQPKWPQEIPQEFHFILAHIETHGAITEQTLIHMLGGPGQGARKARRFAANIQSWLTKLLFNLEITQTIEGKEYRKL